jgi:hypothetical protein
MAGCLVGLPLAAAAYRNEPPPAHTGGFGEPTCHRCHFDGSLNEPGGSLEVRGFPEIYVPDRTYPLEIVVRGPRLRTAGFQLAIRFREGVRAGRSAGRLEPDGRGVAVLGAAEQGVRYAQHLAEGALPAAPGTARWRLLWTAPGAGYGAAVLHAAANAANGDDSEFSDQIYVTSRVSAERNR